MIRRFSAQGYKSLSEIAVSLSPLTVIIGPNAAGKSNFLDGLQLLARLATGRTLKEAFDAPYRGTPLESFTFDRQGIAGSLARERLELQFEVDVELSDATIRHIERQIGDMRAGSSLGPTDTKRVTIRERLLRYRLRLEILPRTGILRVVDEHLAALSTDGSVKSSRNAFIEKVEGRLRLRLEGQAHPTYHDVGLDHTLVSRPNYPPHYPHLAAFKHELEGWSFFYFEPRERMRAANPVKEVRHIGLMGEELAAFLNTLKATDPKQFAAVEKALKVLVPRVSRIEVSPNAVGEVELRLIEDDMAVPARLVSEGTLRMLGLLAVASATEPPPLIAFEEPENGLHPRRIRLLADFLRTRTQVGTQFIVTTHSPALAQLLPLESLYLCRRDGGRTVIQPLKTDGSLFKNAAIEEGFEEMVEQELQRSLLSGEFNG